MVKLFKGSPVTSSCSPLLLTCLFWSFLGSGGHTPFLELCFLIIFLLSQWIHVHRTPHLYTQVLAWRCAKGKKGQVKSGCCPSSQGLGYVVTAAWVLLRTLVSHGHPDGLDLHKPCPCGLAFRSLAPWLALSAAGWDIGLRPFGLVGVCVHFINISLMDSSPCAPGKRRDRGCSWRTWQDRSPGKEGLS